MNIYVQDYLYWKIIPVAIICILIPLLLVIFYSTIGKILQRKRYAFLPNIKMYGSRWFYIGEALRPITFFITMFVWSWFYILLPKTNVLIKAFNDGVNVRTDEFLTQYQFSIDITNYILISFGISLLIIITLKLMNFLKDQSKIKKFITEQYLKEWNENIEKKIFLNTFVNVNSHFLKKLALWNETKFIKKVNILKAKPDAEPMENLKKIHEALVDYLFIINNILFFSNKEKKKQIFNNYYVRAIKILQAK